MTSSTKGHCCEELGQGILRQDRMTPQGWKDLGFLLTERDQCAWGTVDERVAGGVAGGAGVRSHGGSAAVRILDSVLRVIRSHLRDFSRVWEAVGKVLDG